MPFKFSSNINPDIVLRLKIRLHFHTFANEKSATRNSIIGLLVSFYEREVLLILISFQSVQMRRHRWSRLCRVGNNLNRWIKIVYKKRWMKINPIDLKEQRDVCTFNGIHFSFVRKTWTEILGFFFVWLFLSHRLFFFLRMILASIDTNISRYSHFRNREFRRVELRRHLDTPLPTLLEVNVRVVQLA